MIECKIQWSIVTIDYLKTLCFYTMSNFARNENYYWNGGAFCKNCGVLKGNVTNDGIHPIWHDGCKSGCNSTWEDQEFSACDEHEYAHLLDEEERWEQAQYDPREEEEPYLEDERQMEYDSRCEEWEREDMSYEDRVVTPRASSTGPPEFPMELIVNGYDPTDVCESEEMGYEALIQTPANERINDEDWERIKIDWEQFKAECRFPIKDQSYVIQRLEAHAETMNEIDGNEEYEPYNEETERESRQQYDREMDLEDERE